MAIDLTARVNGHSGKSIAEILEETPVNKLQELSRSSIPPLEEFARTLREGSEEERDSAYKALSHFVGLYEGRFNVPNMDSYKTALQAYEAKQSLAH